MQKEQFRLLLIDDRAENLFILEEIIDLHLPGCKVFSSTSAKEGLTIAAREMPDGILVDFQMPEMDGVELCKRVKSDPKLNSIPVIMITAHQTTPSIRIRGLEAGAVDFISRPVDGVELTMKLKGVLSTRKRETELIREKRELESSFALQTKRLERTEELYQTLFDSAGDAIVFHDEDGLILDVNQQARQLLRCASPVLFGVSLFDLLPDSSSECFMNNIKLLQKKDNIVFECPFEACDEKESFVSVRSNILNVSGARFVLSTFRDITQQKKSQQELLIAKQKAEESNRSKSEFLANMSHEIRTPLNGIMGMLQLMQTTTLNSEQKEYSQVGLNSCKRLTRLLSDILDLSKIEAGKMSIENRPFCFPDIMQSVNELFRESLDNKDIELTIKLDENLKQCLVGDSARLLQVLFNIVGNAVKFTEEGTIAVEIMPLPRNSPEIYRVLFCVSDTGIGIEDAKQQEVFKTFVQGEEAYKRNFQGAGLGLPIITRLVGLMGGTACISSEVGVGTDFYFCIPFQVPAESIKEVSTDSCPHDTCGRTYDVLLAEDDAVNQLAIRGILEKHGHRVATVGTGKDALEYLRNHSVDLVLMDIRMPEMDGTEAIVRIRDTEEFGAKATIPIIAITAHAMTGDKAGFIAAGADRYLSKPVDAAEMLKLVNQVMETKG